MTAETCDCGAPRCERNGCQDTPTRRCINCGAVGWICRDADGKDRCRFCSWQAFNATRGWAADKREG